MAIKVNGTTVIDDNRKFVGQRIRLGSYATENLPSVVEGDVSLRFYRTRNLKSMMGVLG